MKLNLGKNQRLQPLGIESKFTLHKAISLNKELKAMVEVRSLRSCDEMAPYSHI